MWSIPSLSRDAGSRRQELKNSHHGHAPRPRDLPAAHRSESRNAMCCWQHLTAPELFPSLSCMNTNLPFPMDINAQVCPGGRTLPLDPHTRTGQPGAGALLAPHQRPSQRWLIYRGQHRAGALSLPWTSAEMQTLQESWHKAPGSTLRLSTGRVTLNMSMVLTMMAGVVRKKRRMKRQILRRMNRSHQDVPRTDRFSLGEERMTWTWCGGKTMCPGSPSPALQLCVLLPMLTTPQPLL